MTYLLDTNAWITALRQPNSLLEVRLRSMDVADIRVCSVVVAEMRLGCLRSAKPTANRAKVDALLAPYLSFPFDDSGAEEYALIRRYLESMGQVIGPYDMQIAAIARLNNWTLVSHNTAEFSRVPGLKLEDWEIP